MEDLYAALHTWATNLVGSHPIACGVAVLFVFVIRPMAIAFLKDAYPKRLPPNVQEILDRAEIRAILKNPIVTREEQERAVSALVLVIAPPPLDRPPVVAGILAALGIVTNWYRWIFQKIGLTPPSEDVVGSSAEILLPKEAKP